jgi:RNA polymerase sigma-70 factor (ECF subfamily)
MLRAWLNRHFPSIGDLDDIIQEAYLKILQASIKNQLVSPKAFLFAITRNLALDHVRHRKVERVDHLAEIDDLAVMDRDRDVPETIAHAQELELLTEAIQSLPKRCRQIVTLRKIYGLPQKEVAAQLGISEHTVEAQGAIALRKISEFFARQDRQQLSKR